MKTKTYGKANSLTRAYFFIKNRFVVSETTKRILRKSQLEAYIPGITRNEKIGAMGVIVCILTPGTNWAIPIFWKVMLK